MVSALDLWEQLGTQDIIDQLQQVSDPEARLRALFETAFGDLVDGTADAALMARIDDPVVWTGGESGDRYTCRVPQRDLPRARPVPSTSGGACSHRLQHLRWAPSSASIDARGSTHDNAEHQLPPSGDRSAHRRRALSESVDLEFVGNSSRLRVSQRFDPDGLSTCNRM